MSKTLAEIAQQLKDANKKVQLIYAFNGTGKTRLSREFKKLIAPKNDEIEGDDAAEQPEISRNKILYYNAFTEDLFYWDNDLEQDADPKLRIHPNSFTDWVLEDQGQDRNIITNFQRYANEKLTPKFNEEYKVKGKDDKEITVKAFSEVTFSLERGDDEQSGNLKISKGEESNFIWSIFYTLIELVIDILNVAEPSDRETNVFDQLEYVFIDDPVSSLDENHLIELAVDLAQLIKSNNSDVKFIITTHNPLFYNVLHNELNSDDGGYKKKWLDKYRMARLDGGTFQLVQQPNDSPFSYHLYLKSELENAIESGQLSKYHFNFLRNILEKTSTFLGYKKWGDLLPKTDDGTTNPYE
ncbi:AAA family ATPase, partial [Serratia marcescens]